MTRHSYSTEVLELSTSGGSNNTIKSKDGDGSSSSSGFWSRGRIVLAVLICASVVGLALGLGLGLGLSSGSESEISTGQTSCRAEFSATRAGPRAGTRAGPRAGTRAGPRAGPRARFHARSVSEDNSTWVPESCPVPGNPKCPSGFTKPRPPLFVLSLDGFRAEYLLRGATPMLKRLGECGLQAPYMRAMFPTKTFPNHYTLVTGMYAESHGIIDNFFYDPLYNETFAYGGRNNSDNRWWGGEPIWNTATKAGLKVATVMWVGSDVNIQGIRSDICYNYNSSVPLDVRISEILSFFDGDPQDFPDLVAFYFEQPDSAGHQQGPFGDWVMSNLTYVDGLISDLVRGLEEREMGDCFNFVIAADHGMESTSCSESVDISRYLDTQSLYTVYTGPHARMSSQYLLSRDNNNHQPVPVERTLAELSCRHYNETRDWYVRFHAKEDLPKRYHYALHPRIDEIVMDVEAEYSVVNLNGGSCSVSAGNHGYDNTLSSMHAMFIAYGPAFRQGLEVEEFENIELYNLLADVLGITPAPNNGTYGLLHELLHQPPPITDQSLNSTTPTDSPDTTTCTYPDDVTERERRRNSSDCSCSDWTVLSNRSVEEMDEQLNLTSGESERSFQTHLPMGAPSTTIDDVSCRLVQNDYVTGFSDLYKMPLWSAFHVTPGSISVLEPGSSRSDKVVDSCYRPDVRVTSQIDCSAHTNLTAAIRPALLYPPGFSNGTVWETDGYISSNVVPMYENFRWGVWREVLQLLEEYAENYRDVHVTTGPVFDYNIDGLRDSINDIPKYVTEDGLVPVPSHYYMIITRCTQGQGADYPSCYNATTALSFILPHKSSYTECWDRAIRDYLRRHVARVKDIQLLTGLTYFPDLEQTDPARYRRLTTHLSEQLWSALGWMDSAAAAADPCPAVEQAQCPEGYNKPPVVLISLDGFRPDYLDRGLSPTLEALRGCGARARYMHPVYPSMTFPNHHTISTGLYPESHGIVDNSMYDMSLNESFYLGSPTSLNPAWWQGQPIWTTLELNNRTAMTFFWPGSEVPFEGRYPTRYMDYDGQVPYSLRVDTVLSWLNGSEGIIPELVALYLSKVDSSGHQQGPHSIMVDEAIRTVDEALLRLMDGLYRMKLHTCVNIVIVSDHGMSDISCEDQSVLVSDKLPAEYLDRIYVYTGSNGRVSNKYHRTGNDYYIVPEQQRVPAENLTEALSCELTNLVSMETREFPVKYHYSGNSRTDDVQLLMADSWLVGYTSAPYCSIKGQHGWDPHYENMKAIFVGYGPAFNTNQTVEPFANIEIYNLLAHLTQVDGAPNNGTEGSLYHLLRTPPTLLPVGQPPESGYFTCPHPLTDEEYWQRANSTNSACQCIAEIDDVRLADDRLNMTEGETEVPRTLHCGVLGVPLIRETFTSSGAEACLLHHNNYVSGYSRDLRLPLWTSFRLTAAQVNGSNPGSAHPLVDCTRGDVRVEEEGQVTCEELEQVPDQYVQVRLFPSNWSSDAESSSESSVSSNTVSMLRGFYEDVWSQMMLKIEHWAESNTDIQVILGPAFDHNSDGLKDENITRIPEGNVSLASHYFIVTSRCGPGTMVCPGVDTQAFVLPHRQPNKAERCLTRDEYLTLNSARVRDVELLTGLEFFTSSSLTRQPSIQSRIFYLDRLWL